VLLGAGCIRETAYPTDGLMIQQPTPDRTMDAVIKGLGTPIVASTPMATTFLPPALAATYQPGRPAVQAPAGARSQPAPAPAPAPAPPAPPAPPASANPPRTTVPPTSTAAPQTAATSRPVQPTAAPPVATSQAPLQPTSQPRQPTPTARPR
jgi:hypothetical protein